MFELAFLPDRARRESVARQLEERLRELIATGRLAAGARLPASRELAKTLGLARNTVNAAYEALREAGLVSAHVGQGTFVRAAGPSLAAVRTRAQDGAPRPALAWGGLFARRARELGLPRESLVQPAPGALRFDFRGGAVDEAALPGAALGRALARAAGAELPRLANALDPFGHPPLRAEIARRLVARGIAADADRVLVVDGAQQALDLVARVLVEPGDGVAMEQPGYFGAALAFRFAQADVVGVGVDGEGLRTDELARILRARRLKLVYATPAVQCPTGVALAPARRAELLALADAHQLPIVEDDFDSELRLAGPARPALAADDPAGLVIYVGTFSKALFPGLRMGFVVAPRALLDRLALARFAADLHSSTLVQAALLELLRSGALERHVRGVRRRNQARLAALLAGLEAAMPAGARWSPPAGGGQLWLRLPPEVDAEGLHAAAREAGFAYARGGLFRLDGGGAHELALSFARGEPERIRAGAEALGELVRRFARTRAPRAGSPRRAKAAARSTR